MTKTLSTLEEGTIPEETMLKHEPVHKVVIYADHNGCKVHPPHLLVEPNETIVVKALKTDIQVFLPEGGPFDFDPALIGERVIRLPWEPRGVVVSIKADKEVKLTVKGHAPNGRYPYAAYFQGENLKMFAVGGSDPEIIVHGAGT